MKDCILYIHGFNSSPLSTKAQQTKHYLSTHFPKVDFFCPQLVTSPAAAIEQLISMMETQNKIEQSRLKLQELGSLQQTKSIVCCQKYEYDPL